MSIASAHPSMPGPARIGPTGDESRRRCPACRSVAVETFFELDGLPVLCNVLWADQREAAAAPRGDLHLGRCGVCGLIQNVAFDADRLSYGPAYENTLHCSAVFRDYAEELARDLVERHALRGGSAVEIGCGQGEFLRGLLDAGLSTARGFDPAFDPRRADALPPSASIVAREFDPSQLGETPDLICARHVLEHLARPRSLLEGLHAALAGAASTTVYVEVPAGEWALSRAGMWDLIYEHCVYYTAESLRSLIERVGFRTVAVRRTYGGQFLAIEAAAGARSSGEAPDVAVSHRAALTSRELTAGYARRHDRELRSWRSAVDRLADRGARPVVWGVGSKGVTFLNLLDPGGKVFVAAVDLNPAKQGRFVSGTGHPIVGPETLSDCRPTHVVVMNALYRREIERTLETLGIKATVMGV